MTKTDERFEVTPQVLEAMRQSERDNRWLEEHPEALEPYRGQWVVVYQQRIIAHSPDAREAARAAPARTYPGSTLFYVPTREEAEAVRIL
ncbi:MAG: hypothetical protein HY332_09240 [Chloroflexi bacterium]|nr:hypothetical protein [Chloroflexota bacterium]